MPPLLSYASKFWSWTFQNWFSVTSRQWCFFWRLMWAAQVCISNLKSRKGEEDLQQSWPSSQNYDLGPKSDNEQKMGVGPWLLNQMRPNFFKFSWTDNCWYLLVKNMTSDLNSYKNFPWIFWMKRMLLGCQKSVLNWKLKDEIHIFTERKQKIQFN